MEAVERCELPKVGRLGEPKFDPSLTARNSATGSGDDVSAPTILPANSTVVGSIEAVLEGVGSRHFAEFGPPNDAENDNARGWFRSRKSLDRES